MSMPQYRYWQTATDGKWRFALVASNGEPLGPSQGYTLKSGVLRGIEAHRRAAQIAQVVETQGPPSARKAPAPAC